MKAVMMSIQPKWCELIASGKKTVEVRKTRPKLETPFKAYIYCTKGKEILAVSRYSDKSVFLWDKSDVDNYNSDMIRNGKIIGEFMCYDIGEYETEFYPKGQKQVYEAIYQYNEDEEVWEPVLTNDTEQETQFAKDTCLSIEDFRNYLGAGEIGFYGLCISDLIIYDEPKELSEFHLPCNSECNGICEYGCVRLLKRPPQSWCYVEEIR